MAESKNWQISQDMKNLVSCNLEVDLFQAEVKALEEGLISKEVFDHLMSLKSKVPVAERYTTLLKHVHEILQERLNTSDARATAAQAVAEELIDKDILVNIASLSQKVPGSLKARYLLQFLQPALQNKLEQLMSHVMKIESMPTNYKDMRLKLNEYSIPGHNFKCLIPLCPQKDEEFSQQAKILELLQKEKDQLNLERFGKISISPIQNEPTTVLGPQHFLQLNELLADYAYKWKNIGVALNFQPQDLQTIEATPLLIPGAPKSYLFRLLQDWLQMTLRHTLPPTVENLKKAINSQTVGLGVLCSELQAVVKSIQSSPNYNQPYSSTKVSFNTKTPSVHPKRSEVYIEEGESTLLEIEVTTAGKGNPIYAWKMRGNACGFQHIFYLHKADIASDGDEMTCKVIAGISSVVTVPITVHVSCPLDEFTPSLASMYLSRPEVPEDTWPPTGSKRYINLAIIKQQKVNYGSEYARFTIQGDIDDVLQDKEPIDYAKMYVSLKRERQVMFIEGRPGSGKTTFVYKITRDWASNSSGGIRILLLVSLRVLNTLHNPNLLDILNLFRDLKVTREIIEKRDGKGVCFIFDGLDEFSPSDGKDSIVYKIINRSYLHQSTVVVASRPAALAEIRNKADKIIEVIGFLGNQIQEYFDHYPFSDATKPEKLKNYLSLHPNICHMCYLPIHATMVAFLFEVTGQVPKTETEIYALFTHFTLVRSITKTQDIQPNSEDDILKSLNEEESYNFQQICQLALNKTLLNKQVLHQKEINSFFRATKGDKSLGLITIDRTADLYSFKDVYTFLHLTFQEYLAAYHISTLSDEEQMKLIEEHGHKNHMLVVWKFFCGLVEIKPFDNKFKSILHKSQENTLHHFQCAYESQQKIVCAQLLKVVHYDIQLANKFLSTPDFTAIGYVTNKTILPVKLLLRNCDVDIPAIDALLSEIDNSSNDFIKSLQVEDKALNSELILKLLANFHGLKSLCLVKQTLYSNTKHVIKSSIPQPASTEFIVLKNIQTLTLKGFQDESLEFQILMTAIRQCENLTELTVTDNKIGKLGAKHLSQNLPHCRNLQRINISNNGMSSDEVLNVLHSMKQLKLSITSSNITNQGREDRVSSGLILKHLKPFTNLQSLDIVLGPKDVDYFKQSSKNWKDLRELRITANPPHTKGVASAVFRSLELYFHSIEKLVIKKAIYSLEGGKNLTNGILQCPNLRILNISGSLITQEQLKLMLLSVNFSRLEEFYLCDSIIDVAKIALLSSHLHGFQSLQKLDLSSNSFSISGAKTLAVELHHCTKLTKLNLQDNMIDSDAAYAIAAGLRLCTDMKVLSLSREHCEQFATAFEQEDKQNRKQRFGSDTIKFL